MINNDNIKNLQSTLIMKWLEEHSSVCRLRSGPLAYNPKRLSTFSIKGEEMVESLTMVGSLVFQDFTKLISLDEQIKLATETFESFKGTKFDKPGKKGNLGYFRTKRTFNSLVPMEYHRTPLAPRLTTKGNTFHGMNKALLIEIVKKLTDQFPQMLVLELDMSACHSRVACSLMPPNSELEKALSDSHFWETQVNQFLPLYTNEGIEITFKILKRILKVFLYTSLNGGNPASEERLIDNLTGNAMELLPNSNLTSSKIFNITKKVANSSRLVTEVKDLNKKCYMKGFKRAYTFTVDRFKPYVQEMEYKGISRVLQGFEVCLLSVLTLHVMQKGFLPLSLDHDGLMALVLFKEGCETNEESITKMVKDLELELSEKMNEWAHYLLKTDLPIEAKRHWFRGEVVEY